MTIHQKISAQEIIERIKHNQAMGAANARNVAQSLSGLDYNFDSRASFKDNKEPAVQGAHLLNDKNDNVILKGCAPTAPAYASGVMGDLSVAGKDKVLAAPPATPIKDLAGSLHSPNEEEGNLNEDEHSEQDEFGDESASDVLLDETPGLWNPDFYKIRVDLFDNGEQKNKTRYTAKFTCCFQPEDTDADKYEVYANFFSRTRDFRRAINSHDMWDGFYDEVVEAFDVEVAAERDYKIKPMLAVLKERTKGDFGSRYEPLGYTAAIMYQVHGKDPVVLMVYQDFLQEIPLNQTFTAQKSSTLYKIGIYRDPARTHLEPKHDKPNKMVVRSAADFKRK